MKYILMFMMLGIIGCESPKRICERKTIAEVGGCDYDGYCAVLFTDGTNDRRMYPVKGMRMNVCYY